MRGPVFTISNFLSLLRIILILPIMILLEKDSIANTTTILILAFLSCLTDYFDGYFARKLNQVSDLGRILDPVADKLAIAIIAFSLYYHRGFPLWLFIVIITRDLLIMLAALVVIGRRKIILQSNIVGKLTVGIIAGTILIYIGNFQSLYGWATKVSLIAIIASGISYSKGFIMVVRDQKRVVRVHQSQTY